MELHVSELVHDDLSDFCALIREVYDEFVAPDYADEGNRTFYSYVSEEAVHDRMHGDGALMISAKADDRIVGACSFRDVNHLSTFFVKKEYHGRGVGRMMFAYALSKLKTDHPGLESIEVNSSPFALPVYKRLGFVLVDGRKEKDGIIYYPMKYEIALR